jgi:iron(II)-dependent oxidoreductase
VIQVCWPKSSTCPVGASPDGNSPTGLADMAGNVWEWTSSSYSTDYGSPRSDPAKVDRGGDYNGSPATLRAYFRSRTAPTERLAWLGFRCAK